MCQRNFAVISILIRKHGHTPESGTLQCQVVLRIFANKTAHQWNLSGGKTMFHHLFLIIIMFYVPRISLAPLIVLITLPPSRAHCPLVWCQRCGERTTKVCCGQDNVYTASLPAAAAVSPLLIGQCPCRRRPIGREDDGSVWLAAGVPAASRIFVWIEDISQLLFEIFINVVCQTLGTRVWNLTHKLLRKMQYQLHWIQSSCEML